MCKRFLCQRNPKGKQNEMAMEIMTDPPYEVQFETNKTQGVLGPSLQLKVLLA